MLNIISVILVAIPVIAVGYLIICSFRWQKWKGGLWVANEILKSYRLDEIPKVDLKRLMSSEKKKRRFNKSLSLMFDVGRQERFMCNTHYQLIVIELKEAKSSYDMAYIVAFVISFAAAGLFCLINRPVSH